MAAVRQSEGGGPRHEGERLPGASPLKRRVSRFMTNKLVNPLVRRLIEAGVFPRSHALLETIGHKSGVPPTRADRQRLARGHVLDRYRARQRGVLREEHPPR